MRALMTLFYINYFAIKQLEMDFSISYFPENILQINDINKLLAQKTNHLISFKLKRYEIKRKR